MLLLESDEGEEAEEGKGIEISWIQNVLSLEICYNTEWVFWLRKEDDNDNDNDNDDDDGEKDKDNNNNNNNNKEKKKKKNDVICQICKQVANNAMELICSEHELENEPVIVGEQCLLNYFQKHPANNQNKICPIGNHENCQYFKSKIVRRAVDDWIVICPRQFQLIQTQRQKKQKYPSTTATSSIMAESETEMEGSINDICKEGDTNMCMFKGKIKDLKEHLNGSCVLNPIDCEFKIFGCNNIIFKHNLIEHMQSFMPHHLQLVAQKAKKQYEEMNELQQKNETINQSLKQSKDQIIQLQLEKNELQSKILFLQKENDICHQITIDSNTQISQLKLENERMNELQYINDKILQEKKKRY